jgi:hypothetical protein
MGGRRRRWVTREEAPVWCPGGRWGPRRVRVGECWASVRAEDLYSGILRDDPARVAPGARGSAVLSIKGREFGLTFEVRQNAVWRAGRVFLVCPRCSRRCTRLYVPTETAWLACRRCWGLTYLSRTQHNYKDSQWGRGQFARVFGITQRAWSYGLTDEARQTRREASRRRWAARRRYLRRP